MKTWNAAVVGAGFIGRVHMEALRRLGHIRIRALADPEIEKAKRVGAEFSVERVEPEFAAILEDPAIDAVHVCTPNHLHVPVAKAALEAGKHVLCEKPLATSAADAQALVALAAARGRRAGLCHNLRYYPLVQHTRQLCASGELGEILVVQGTYSQDWLLYNTDWNWRVTSTEGGPSRAMADIGSHWFDMAEHVTGLRLTSLCADLQTFHKTRKRPKGAIETFAGKLAQPAEYDEVPVDTEDFGAVIFRLGERARGCVTASQVSAGRKNRLSLEVYGAMGSAAWDQERPDELWQGQRNVPNRILIKDPSLLQPGARSFADLPGGHSEGYDDTFKQVFRRFYESLENPEVTPDYPLFSDGLRQLRIVEAEMESSRKHAWVDLKSGG
jgi:predicted dehydrogenase